jgi:hypothetical protein
MRHLDVVFTKIFFGHGFCSAEHADFTDIQQTVLIGSLEMMGTLEAQK